MGRPMSDEIEEEGDEGEEEEELESDDEYDYDEQWDDEQWDDDIDSGGGLGWARRSVSKLKPKRMKKNKKTIADVEWMPNKDAPNCLACDKKFGVTNRRHHCRRCGAVFCNGCTKARLKWKDPEEEVRRECPPPLAPDYSD